MATAKQADKYIEWFFSADGIKSSAHRQCLEDADYFHHESISKIDYKQLIACYRRWRQFIDNTEANQGVSRVCLSPLTCSEDNPVIFDLLFPWQIVTAVYIPKDVDFRVTEKGEHRGGVVWRGSSNDVSLPKLLDHAHQWYYDVTSDPSYTRVQMAYPFIKVATSSDAIAITPIGVSEELTIYIEGHRIDSKTILAELQSPLWVCLWSDWVDGDHKFRTMLNSETMSSSLSNIRNGMFDKPMYSKHDEEFLRKQLDVRDRECMRYDPPDLVVMLLEYRDMFVNKIVGVFE